MTGIQRAYKVRPFAISLTFAGYEEEWGAVTLGVQPRDCPRVCYRMLQRHSPGRRQRN